MKRLLLYNSFQSFRANSVPAFDDLSYLMSASHVVETDGQEDEPDDGGEEPVADDP